MKPHIVKAIEDPSTGERRLTVPAESYRIPVKPEHLSLVTEAMVGVNTSGTGRVVFAGAPYRVAGKTGTAQVRRRRRMRTEIAGPGYSSRAQRTLTLTGRLFEALHIDGPLLLSVLAVCVAGLVVLFSAAGEDVHIFLGQAARVGISYPLYIVHPLLGYVVMRLLMAAGAPYVAALLVAVALVVAVAVVLHRYVEAPSIAFARRLAARLDAIVARVVPRDVPAST